MKVIKTKSVELKNVFNNNFDVVLASNFDLFFVKTSDGIMQYDMDEMLEQYNVDADQCEDIYNITNGYGPF